MPTSARDPIHTTDQGGADVLAPLVDQLETTTVVLDTCVLIADPESLYGFGTDDIVLPLTVIEELDGLKTRPDDVGRNAREVLRTIEELRVANHGSVSTSVPLPAGGTLRVEPNGLRLDELAVHHLSADVPDHRILAAALGLRGDGHNVTVVSNDAAVRIKADALGLPAVEHRRAGTYRHTAAHPGWHDLEVGWETTSALFADKSVALDDLPEEERTRFDKVLVNEFVVARDGKNSVLTRMTAGDSGLALATIPTGRSKQTAWGLEPKNKEQAFALNLLLDPEVPVVAMSGAAGTGKTILAIAAGLEQTFERGNRYSRMTILRPVISVGGQELGFLPGDVAEKLGPWFAAIVDAMVALSDGMTHRQARERLDAWSQEERLTMEAVTYLRGRSLQDTYVIVDEAQNLEASTIKTIVTRLGEGSKAVLCGDVEQIDNPYLSASDNGLAVLAGAFGGQSLFGQVVLLEGRRSAAANLAATCM